MTFSAPEQHRALRHIMGVGILGRGDDLQLAAAFATRVCVSHNYPFNGSVIWSSRQDTDWTRRQSTRYVPTLLSSRPSIIPPRAA